VTQRPDPRIVLLILWLREQKDCRFRKSSQNQFMVVVVFWNMVVGLLTGSGCLWWEGSLNRYVSLFSHGSGCSHFFSVATLMSEQSLLHFTAVEAVVTGDCRLNLSGSTIKLISSIISSAMRKGYKSPPPTSSHTI